MIDSTFLFSDRYHLSDLYRFRTSTLTQFHQTYVIQLLCVIVLKRLLPPQLKIIQ